MVRKVAELQKLDKYCINLTLAHHQDPTNQPPKNGPFLQTCNNYSTLIRLKKITSLFPVVRVHFFKQMYRISVFIWKIQ